MNSKGADLMKLFTLLILVSLVSCAPDSQPTSGDGSSASNLGSVAASVKSKREGFRGIVSEAFSDAEYMLFTYRNEIADGQELIASDGELKLSRYTGPAMDSATGRRYRVLGGRRGAVITATVKDDSLTEIDIEIGDFNLELANVRYKNCSLPLKKHTK